MDLAVITALPVPRYKVLAEWSRQIKLVILSPVSLTIKSVLSARISTLLWFVPSPRTKPLACTPSNRSASRPEPLPSLPEYHIAPPPTVGADVKSATLLL